MTSHDVAIMKGVAEIMARSAILNAKVAGMIAENEWRKSLSHYVAPYTEEEFNQAIDESGVCHNSRVLELNPQYFPG